MKYPLSTINFKGQPPNYQKIDNFISRSAQPQKEDFEWLKSQGVTDIINFRTFTTDRPKFDEETIVKKQGMTYHNIPSNSRYPEESKVFQFLDLIKKISSQNKKVHIHCMHGADRTGLYSFIYKSIKGIGTMQENEAEWIKYGLKQDKYPNLMNWGKAFLEKIKTLK